MKKINLSFSNAINISENKSKFVKAHSQCVIIERKINASLGTNCIWDDTRQKNKTIFYDNAVVKVYNVPIFYFPKLAHPDPTVKESGFLNPTYQILKT